MYKTTTFKYTFQRHPIQPNVPKYYKVYWWPRSHGGFTSNYPISAYHQLNSSQ